MATEHEEIEKTIAQLEAQRATLGDATVDTAIKALREQLDALRDAPAQQRKLVTVMFADMQGFTAMSETMDAEEVSDLMGRLWTRLDAIVAERGGMVARHLGDALMALWGADDAREDDPEQAIRAALEIQSVLLAGNVVEDAPQLMMRVGINTGPALVGGTTTTGEFNIMGDTVNVASRLEHAAPVGKVLISHDTYRHARGLFDVEAWEPLAIKGKAEPMRVYLVQAAKERAFRVWTRGVRGVETRTIGRAAELKTLQDAFTASVTERKARLVNVVGDAGLGKSRLLYEFDTNWLELQPGNLTVLRGRATSDTSSVPHSIIRDMLRLHCEIYDSDPAATVLEKFRAGLSGALDADRADVVGHFTGFDFSSSAAVRSLMSSPSFGELARADLVRFLRHLAADGALAIFLDDIHWADASSLALLRHILGELAEETVFALCLTRPDLFERFPDWDKAGPKNVRIDLYPLSAEESRALVTEILRKVEDIPERLRDLIVENAAGNPYYAEELIGNLIEDGTIVRGEETWRVEPDRLTDLRVPPTLTGILQARLDGLPESEKQTMQRASVVGRLFWGATVDALVEEPHEQKETLALLESAAQRDLIFRQGRSAFADTPQYIFKHAILREVTYETVLLKLRRQYHAQVARWLETNSGERIGEYLGLIAQHYEKAGENERAVEYLLGAGQDLKEHSAFSDAIGAVERALALTSPDDDATRAAVLAELGDLHEKIGDYAAAQKYLGEALALARAAGNPGVLVQALVWSGVIALRQGNLEQSAALNEEALALATKLDLPFYTALAHMSNGLGAYMAGDMEKARAAELKALEMFQEQGNAYRVSQCLNNLGNFRSKPEDVAQARAYYEESLAISQAAGHRSSAARTLNNLGYLAYALGNYREALAFYEQSLPVFEDVGDRVGYLVVLTNMGHTSASLDENDAALDYYRQALRLAVRASSQPNQLEIVAGIAMVYANRGDLERAAQLAGLAVNHPAFTTDAQDITDPLLERLREAMPKDQLEAALGQGGEGDLDTVVEGFMAGDPA